MGYCFYWSRLKGVKLSGQNYGFQPIGAKLWVQIEWFKSSLCANQGGQLNLGVIICVHNNWCKNLGANALGGQINGCNQMSANLRWC